MGMRRSKAQRHNNLRSMSRREREVKWQMGSVLVVPHNEWSLGNTRLAGSINNSLCLLDRKISIITTRPDSSLPTPPPSTSTRDDEKTQLV